MGIFYSFICSEDSVYVFLLQRFHEHLLELLQVDLLHHKSLVFLIQLLHVVQDHHASCVFPLQLHRHSNLETPENVGP